MLKRTVSFRGSFEYPQHMFWMRNKENNFPKRTLIWRPDMTYFSMRGSRKYGQGGGPENFFYGHQSISLRDVQTSL